VLRALAMASRSWVSFHLTFFTWLSFLAVFTSLLDLFLLYVFIFCLLTLLQFTFLTSKILYTTLAIPQHIPSNWLVAAGTYPLFPFRMQPHFPPTYLSLTILKMEASSSKTLVTNYRSRSMLHHPP
jgi:hypothetical protein